MKNISKAVSSLLLIAFALTLSQCSKKKEDTDTCKICKALAQGPDQQTIQKEVCTPEEEQSFRNAHPGREISCQ
jgi:hypothetical protein